VLSGDLLHAIHGEEQLEVNGLLGPQRAIVIEHHDALRWRDKLSTSRFRRGLNEIDDCLFDAAVSPRTEWIGLRGGSG
jgi:hypothetical protein